MLNYTRADSTDPDTAAALRTLRESANGSSRKVLWVNVTEHEASDGRNAELADVATTLDHDDFAEQLWSMGPHAVVVIDDPAAADPEQLAAVTAYTISNGARVIILDPANGHHGPSTPALRLLAHTLPWTTDLTRTAANAHPDAPTPAITLADRLGRAQLNESWQRLLVQYDSAARNIRSAHRLNLTLTWHERSHTREDPHTSRSAGLDD
jgi:hypothetical protein